MNGHQRHTARSNSNIMNSYPAQGVAILIGAP